MSLFNELKRRNVFRVGLAYVVSAWVIAQVASLVLNSTTAPSWVMQAILLVLGLGFVIALIISWAYELTPEGLKKDADVSRDDPIANHTAKKLDYITIIAAITVLGLFVYQQMNPKSMIEKTPELVKDSTTVNTEEIPKAIEVPKVSDTSIAVLPFVDLSPNKDQAYFSDGIAEEILNVLVRIDHLKVASRTSAFGFKGQEALGIPTIAKRLKVRHVLEGSVRKSGETVRITAQLIDAETDMHLWSETFDRQLTTENIFAVQDEIAAAIVKVLGLMIGDQSTPQVTVKKTTDNLDAYELFLKAQGMYHSRSRKNLPEIAELYEKAVAIDPEFAEAWAGLAATYMVFPGWNLGTVEDSYPKALDAADRATSIDDQLALPYTVRGSIATDGGDMIGGIEQMDKALVLDPKNLNTVYFRAAVLLDLGYFDQAKAGLEHCLELDPSYDICTRFLSIVLLYQGEFDQANALFEAGMLKGQKSYRNVYIQYYSAIEDTRALSLLLSLLNLNRPAWYASLRYRYLTDNSYNFDTLSDEVYAYSGGVDEAGKPIEKMTFENWSIYPLANFLFSPYLPALRKPDMREEYLQLRRKLIIKNNLAYWQKHGFPPQCRAVGEDDFECDLNVYGEQ